MQKRNLIYWNMRKNLQMVKNIADGKEQATVEKQKALLWELIYFQE